MPVTTLTRTRQGVVKALNLAGVADGTELNGFRDWVVYENGGAGNGFYEVRGGELRQVAFCTTQLALWGDPAVGLPGQCIVADVWSTVWGTNYQGLAANGVLDHSDNLHSFYYNSFDIRHRTTGDYGQGFLVATGTLPGQPFTNSQWYTAKFGVVQETGLGHPRMSGAFAGAVYQADTTAGTGVNDGSATYPGLIAWAAAATTRWRNLYVTHDYRLTVRSLTGTQGFRLYDATNTVIASSAAQSGGAAQVNIIDLAWPFDGYVQVFDDAGTWASPSAYGRWPASGTDPDIYGGDVLDLPSITLFAVQVNWDDTPDWPAFWTDPPAKDVTLDVVDCRIERRAANPDVQADTLTLTLRDPTRKYVPASTVSTLYPNVRLNRKVRVVAIVDGVGHCLYYGTVAGYKPEGQAGEKATTVRAESPLRALANADTRAVVSATEVVGADGTSGAVWQVLDAIAALVDADHRTLEPSPDAVPDNMLREWTSAAEALQQLAILTDSVYSVRPYYRTLSTEQDWHLFWQYRDAKVGVTADYTWDAATEGFVWDVEYSDDG